MRGIIRSRDRQKGQGLVEYALILVLVAIVVLIILATLGTGVQRIVGLIGGALGSNISTNEEQLKIDYAECYVHSSPARTGIWVRGTTNLPLGELVGSTDKNYGGNIETTSEKGSNFKYEVQLTNKADVGACAMAVVIQSKNGTVAAARLQVKQGN